MTVEYLYPASIQEAIDILEERSGAGRLIAGGTDVLPDINHGNVSLNCLVDITRIPGLDQITVTDGVVTVGAAVTFAKLKDSEFINQRVHALASAARSVGSLAIQNAATWAGNLVQAMPAADGAIIAMALGAEVRIVDSQQDRWVSVRTIFEGPGVSAVDPTRQFLTHIRFPEPQEHCGTGWRRIGRRPSLVLPILNCAVRLQLTADDQRIEQVAIALGPVAPIPFRAEKAEQFLQGQNIDLKVFEDAASLALQEANPRTSIQRASREYRLSVIPPMVVSVLQEAVAHAQPTEANI